MKKFAKVLQYFVWIVGCWNSLNILLTSHPSNVKCIFPTLFGDWFGGQDCSLCTYNLSAKEVGWLDRFSMKQLRTLHSYQKFKIKIQKSKTYSANLI
jgi:hypothetical protein